MPSPVCRTACLALALAMPAATVLAQAGVPAIGSRSPEGGLHLYRQPIEMYWDDWRGEPTGKRKGSTVEVSIHGIGKMAQFDGIVAINCTSGRALWQPGTRDTHTVPRQALASARKLFCRGR